MAKLMKIVDIVKSNLGTMTLDESDMFIVEMANFLADVTDLPANIVLWTKTQPNELPHNKYRMKVFKNRIHVATFSIGQSTELLWQVNRNKFKLDKFEQTEAEKVIMKFSPLFIQLVDGKISDNDVKYEIKRLKGQTNES